MAQLSKPFINIIQRLSANNRIGKYDSVKIILLALMGLGLGLRVWGIGYGLPYMYHPDEALFQKSLVMLKNSDFNPRFFGYGSLFFYINAIVYWLYYQLGHLLGLFQSISDVPNLQMLGLSVGRSHMPSQIMAGRLASALLGTLCIPVAYWLGIKLSGRGTGLVTAVLIAFSVPLVNHSQFITPNMQTTLLVLLTLVVLIWSDTRHPIVSSILIGLFFGLAIASKYNAAFLIFPIGLTYFWRYGWSLLKKPYLYISGLVTGLTFLVVTPYMVLDFDTFWTDTIFHLQYYRGASHPGMEGNTIRFYLSYLFKQEGAIVFLSVIPVIGYVKSRHRIGLILASFAIPYTLYIFSLNIRNDRTILITLPILLIFAADVLHSAWRRIQSSSSLRVRQVGLASLVTFTTLSTGYLIYMTAQSNITKTTPDNREFARQWIESTIPDGSRIAIESYAPFIDPARYDVIYFHLLTENTPEWYRQQGYNLLVFSGGRFNRYFHMPERYAEQVTLYNALWNSFPELMTFDQNGMTIHVYQVNPSLNE